jgi:hypothetical protein
MFDSTDVTDLPGLRALFQKAFGEARAEEALALYLLRPICIYMCRASEVRTGWSPRSERSFDR